VAPSGVWISTELSQIQRKHPKKHFTNMLLKLNKVLLITNGLLKNRGQKSKNGDEPKGSEET